MSPRLSVLVPVFDAESTLGEALASISAQTYDDFECVLSDDGSSDASRAIARAHAQRDRRFRRIESEHAGIVAALERGRRACAGELIARMDADDRMHPERLERQLALLDERPELSAVGCHVRLFPREGLSDGRLAYEAWLDSIETVEDVRRERFVECPIAHPTLMIRARVLAAFGYRDQGWPEDYDLILRLCEAEHAIAVVPEVLLDWRDLPTRLSRTSERCSIASFTACKAEFLARGFLAQQASYVLWGYGDTGRSLCRELARRGKTPHAIVELHPGRIGQRIAGAPVIAPETLASLPALPIVVSVAGAGPRAQIRAALAEFGKRELRDFVCAA